MYLKIFVLHVHLCYDFHQLSEVGVRYLPCRLRAFNTSSTWCYSIARSDARASLKVLSRRCNRSLCDRRHVRGEWATAREQRRL